MQWPSGKGQRLRRRTSSEDPTRGFTSGSNPAGVGLPFLFFFFLIPHKGMEEIQSGGEVIDGLS